MDADVLKILWQQLFTPKEGIRNKASLHSGSTLLTIKFVIELTQGKCGQQILLIRSHAAG
jgi:hypothetical protein